MANNLIQVKRTSVSGRAANSTTLPNPGELALNMTDGILYSTNGSAVFEIGANNTNAKVTGTLTVNSVSANGGVGANNQRLTSNGSSVHWQDPLIKDLTDVAANGATDTQVLTYNSTLQKWINQNPPVANVIYTTGYYGVFYDTTSQYATGGSNTATVTRLANTFLTNGVTRTANDELQVAYAGVYKITYSLQFTSSSNKNEFAYVWLRKNGTDVPDSATDFGIYPVSGGANGFVVAVTSLVDNADAGDKFQVMWAASDNTTVSMVYLANTAFAPETPSAIVDVTPISNIITAPPGTNTDVTFNDSGLANGAAGFTFTKTTNSVFVANNLLVGNTVNASAFTIDGTFWANSTVVNSSSFQVNGSFTANSTLVNAAAVLVRGGATVNGTLTVNAISANGGVGSAGQVLKSNGSSTFWGTDNADVGSAGQILYRNSSNVLTTSAGLQYDGSAVKVNGRVESIYQAGDEGGELYLNKPANSSIVDGVTIDLYQNKLRIFEAGGTNRGAFIDITAAAAGVGSDLLAGGSGGTVTSVGSGNGLTGGPITNTGSLSVLANTGIVANTTGVYVNAAYIGTISANNASFLGGTAAASFVQNTDSRTLSGNLVISGTYFNPSSNTILLGNATARWVISGNTGDFSSTVNASAYTTAGITANASGVYPASNTSGQNLGTATQRFDAFLDTVDVSDTITSNAGANALLLSNSSSKWIYFTTGGAGAPTTTTRSIGTKIVIWPSLGASSTDYAIGTDNNVLWYSVGQSTASHIWYANSTPVLTANQTGLYHNSLISGGSYIISTVYTANTSGIFHTGTVNAASHTVGTSFTANSTVVNAVSYYAGTLLVANSTVINATHLGGKTEGNLNVNSALTANNSTNLGGVAASGYQTTAGLSANVATLTANNTSFVGAVSAANVVSNSQLQSNLSNYAALSGATFTGTISGNLTGNVVATTVNTATLNATANIVVGSNVLINTTAIQVGNSTVRTIINTTAFAGNVVATTLTGNLTGNVVATTISGNLTGNVVATTISGNLTAVTANVTNKIQVGIPGAFDFGSNAVIEIDANGNTYVQSVIQNANTGNNASADLVVTNDTGNDSFNYVDLGINGSNYNQAGYNISGQNDAYLYASDGNLTIGTRAAKEVVFHANGTTATDRRLTINATAVTIANAAALVANGSTGTAAQILASNGTGVYWSSSANNALNLGGVAAASYQLNSTLNANIASYLPTYTGTMNASRFQVGTNFTANATDVVTSNLTVQGNLIVTGTTVTLNTATLDVKDLNITVAKGVPSAAAANGAGITVDVANAEIVYVNAGNTWLSNIGFSVGNSTSNVSINSTAFIGNVVATRVTANLTGNVTATTITGNLTGNVAATTITGNLTGNVAAVTITGNLTGNVAAVTISGNLTGNVVATTISGNLTGNVVAGTVNATTINATSSIVVGANVSVNTSTLAIGNSTANVFVNSTAFVGNVVATSVTGNLTGNVAAVTISGNLTGNVAAVTISASANINLGATVVANTTGTYATHLGGTAAASFVQNTDSRTLSGNLNFTGSNTTVNAVFRVVNATSNVFFVAANGNIGIHNNTPATDFRVDGPVSIAGAVSDITTLAAGNTTITGFANVSGDGQFSGNVGIGIAPNTTIGLYLSKTFNSDAVVYNMLSSAADSNTSMTAGRFKYGHYSTLTNLNQNKSSDGLTTYNSGYISVYGEAIQGSSTTGGDAFSVVLEGGRFRASNFANGTSANSVSFARGVISFVQAQSSGIISNALGLQALVLAGNNSVTGNITNAFGVSASITSNTSMTIGNGYLYYGSYSGSTTTNKWGLYLVDETNNYLSGNVGIGNTAPAHKLSVNGTTNLAGAVTGITTLAAGNTTITGFINSTSTGQFGGQVTAPDFNSTSDIRFKSDIVVIDNALDRVNQLTGYTFTMNETGERSTGLIAQEVEKVLPEAVKGTDKKTLSYGNMVGLLVEAIKEQNKKIERLESIINKLNNQ